MIVGEIRAVRGPSIFSEEPCVCLSLAFSESDRNLLKQHEKQAMTVFDVMAQRMGFASSQESVKSGDECFFVAVVAEVTTFLQKKVDADEGGPWITKVFQGSVVNIAFSDFHPKTTRLALILALRFAVRMYPRELTEIFPERWGKGELKVAYRRFLKWGERGKKHRIAREVQWSLNRRGVPWFHLDRYSKSKNFIQVGFGRFQHLFDRTTSFESSLIGSMISMSKSNSRSFLADLGFPVTEQVLASNTGAAVVAAESLGYPVVVKVDDGAYGVNVHVNLRDADEVKEAFNMIRANERRSGRAGSNALIVEEYVVGSDYRISVVGGQLLEAYRRIPAQVTGDGERSVAELVKAENKNPLRGEKESSDTTYMRLELNEPELAVLKKRIYP